MADTRYFHLTLWPVQEFVAQARRTRDFWAGSFLLSWLSATALQTVRALGGRIVFPDYDQNFLDWLTGKAPGNGAHASPRQGNMPNRFLAEVPASFDAPAVAESVRTAFRELAEAVWKHDFAHAGLPAPLRESARRIWERQIDGFWHVSWALTDTPESNILDRRKNWRSHHAPEEPGVKCMMMDGWQELSGAIRPNAPERDAFWNALRHATGSTLDLRAGEALCAIAYVKRRFPRVFHDLRVEDMPGGWTLHGWLLEPGVPSVAWIAAAPWWAEVIRAEDVSRQALERVIDAASAIDADYGESDSDLRCVREAYEIREARLRAEGGSLRGFRRLTKLDGSVFFLEDLQLREREGMSEAQEREMIRALAALGKGKPAPFYAILLMDGDSLGKHMSSPELQPLISRSLKRFTEAVPRLVDEHSGFLIYAGGDDVLALLPLDTTLPCAAAIRQSYLDAFDGSGIPATISAAVEFVHIKRPLNRVLNHAHHLLDDVAKEGRGRDAIAVRVTKPGGEHLVWAQPWKIALDDAGQPVVGALAARFAEESRLSEGFSSKFFYRIRERFALMEGTKDAPPLPEPVQRALLATDYLNSAENRSRLSFAEAEASIAELLRQCTPHRRNPDDGSITSEGRIAVDGALLVRFLATKGKDRR